MPRSILTKLAPVGEVEGEGVSIFDYIQNGLVDWEKTRALALPDGLIYLNTEDRPQGTTSMGRGYESLRDELITKFEKLSDPETGKSLNAKVYRKEEVYQGEFMREAPDLYIVIDNYSVAAFPNLRESSRLTGPLTLAGHRLNGMVIVKGPQVRKGGQIEAARLIDLTPTILHIMGVPVPEDMDGGC